MADKIKKQKLEWIIPEPYCVKSPNFNAGFYPECIVLHYSAAPCSKTDPRNFDRIYRWCTTKSTKSVHFYILKDGSLWQCVSLAQKSWHAGESEYKFSNGVKRTSMNKYGIGVEFDNVGPITEKNGKRVDCYGGEYCGPVVKIGKKMWEPYTFEQIFTAKTLIKYLCEMYGFTKDRILGHCDVSPGRKIDPGEHFPWALFHQSTLEQKQECLKWLIPFNGD